MNFTYLAIYAANVLAASPPVAKPDLPGPSGGSLFLVSFFSFVIVLAIGAVIGLVRALPNDPKPTAKEIITGSIVGVVVSAILAVGVTGIYMTITYVSSMVG